ncbi:MAG: IS110 family transposase, partial [Desulfofundulus sp.]
MMPNPLYAGIDVGLRVNRVRLGNWKGEKVAPETSVPNDAYGAQALAESFKQTAASLGCDSLVIGMEATSLYSWHLAWFLASHDLLKELDTQVYLLNPKLIAQFKKAMASDSGKDDSVDALAILDRLRLGRLPHPFTPDDRYLPLQRLTRYRCHLINQLVQEKNYFLSYLFLKCSGLVQQQPFSNPFGAASTAVVTEFFSAEEIAAQSVDELARFIAEKSKNHFDDPQRVAKELKKAARDSYRLADKLKQPVNTILASSLARIRFLQKQIKEVDKEIKRELAAVSNPLLSVPGLGPVFAAGIIAEIGDISRFA